MLLIMCMLLHVHLYIQFTIHVPLQFYLMITFYHKANKESVTFYLFFQLILLCYVSIKHFQRMTDIWCHFYICVNIIIPKYEISYNKVCIIIYIINTHYIAFSFIFRDLSSLYCLFRQQIVQPINQNITPLRVEILIIDIQTRT